LQLAVYTLFLRETLIFNVLFYRFLPYEVCAALGVGSTVFYVYLNYLMVDEEMDEILGNTWYYLRHGSGGRKERDALDQSGHSTAGLIR
jgi:hypothetical protein